MNNNELKAKVIRSNKREFDCLIYETKERIKAVCLREIIKKNHVVVGDDVMVRPQTADERYEIFELCERKNEIFRRIVRLNRKKVISANIDVILIVVSVSKPDYKPFLIDRYLCRAAQWEIPVAIVMNKMDEFDEQFDMEIELRKFTNLGLEVFKVSSTEAELEGNDLDDLQSKLNGKTTICLGQSGVGKSKLITALSNGETQLLSNRLAKGIEKGAHTTSWAEIIDCENFYMVDSPGVRSMAVIDMSPEELPDYFPDLFPYFSKCKFKDCKHEENSKGCSFQALNLADDDDIIIQNRLVSFLKMRDEIESIPEWKK